MNLLLVEDNAEDVTLIRTTLEELALPLRLSVLHYGASVLPFLRRHKPYERAPRPDLILLDLHLPTTDGREILAELQRDPALRDIPVVVLTSSADPQDIAQCAALGAQAYLVKPLEWEPFAAVVKSTIEFWRACEFRKLAKQ